MVRYHVFLGAPPASSLRAHNLDSSSIETSWDIPSKEEEETTIITWPASTQATDSVSCAITDLTFLHPSTRVSHPGPTQPTQDTASYSYCTLSDDASSIANFPTFHFSLHSLTPLAALADPAHHPPRTTAAPPNGRGRGRGTRGSLKTNLLVAVLELDGPDTIRIKKGPDAGTDVALLRLVLGDDSGGICKLTAWREVAEEWAGTSSSTSTQHSQPPLKKGDIVLLQNILASWEHDSGVHAPATAAGASIICSASPQLKSTHQVCYRAMPSSSTSQQDARLRPDLRLGLSDAVVRKVASVVHWFETMAGLAPNDVA